MIDRSLYRQRLARRLGVGLRAASLLPLLLAPVHVAAEFNAGLLAYRKTFDFRRAYREFLPEARHGHARAQYYLGEICEGGVGRPVDLKAAFRWYRESASRGYAPAQLRLARLYRLGLGTEADPAKAFHWQRKAAEQGNVVAQFRLGRHYAQGIGVNPDPVLAYKWWTIAASYGDPDAMAAREALADTLSPEQIAVAAKLAQQWERGFEARRHPP